MAQSIAERFCNHRYPWNCADADSGSLRKTSFLTKSHEKTQGNSFMDEKIEAKTGMEPRAPVPGFGLFRVFR